MTHRLTATERKFTLAIAFATMAVTCIPYLYVSSHLPTGFLFMGFVDHPYDMFAYLGRMTDGALGHLFRIDKFDSLPQPRIFLDLFWTPLGWASRWTGLSLVAAFHSMRLLLGAAVIVGTLPFAALFLKRPADRMLAVALVATSSGLAFLLSEQTWKRLFERYQIAPVDWWFQETITFESLLTNPEFCASALLLLGMTGWGYLALVGASRRNLHLAGICTALLAMIHPIDVPVAAAVLAVFAFVRCYRLGGWAKSLRVAAGLSAYGLPPLLYLVWVFRANPTFAAWGTATYLSPNWLSYAAGYGIPLLLALLGSVASFKRRSSRDLFLLSFFATIPVLLYAPIVFQRRVTLGWHVPICILAAIGFRAAVLPLVLRLAHRFGPPLSRDGVALAGAAILVVLSLPSNVVKLAQTSRAAAVRFDEKGQAASGPVQEFCVSISEFEAISWLKTSATETSGVFCDYRLGQHVPSRAGCNVYVGHWSETPRFERRRNEVAAVFQIQTPDDARREILAKSRCRFLLYGPSEAALGGWRPDTAAYLRQVFRAGTVAVYEVGDKQ